jgi:hypothetical protein
VRLRAALHRTGVRREAGPVLAEQVQAQRQVHPELQLQGFRVHLQRGIHREVLRPRCRRVHCFEALPQRRHLQEHQRVIPLHLRERVRRERLLDQHRRLRFV